MRNRRMTWGIMTMFLLIGCFGGEGTLVDGGSGSGSGSGNGDFNWDVYYRSRAVLKVEIPGTVIDGSTGWPVYWTPIDVECGEEVRSLSDGWSHTGEWIHYKPSFEDNALGYTATVLLARGPRGWNTYGEQPPYPPLPDSFRIDLTAAPATRFTDGRQLVYSPVTKTVWVNNLASLFAPCVDSDGDPIRSEQCPKSFAADSVNFVVHPRMDESNASAPDRREL